ncbi:hypothetical protein GBA52_015375 [Prunus armeniaca]|nr:hypothetical protein GBA52_015375 [Prunus armeniaca]
MQRVNLSTYLTEGKPGLCLKSRHLTDRIQSQVLRLDKPKTRYRRLLRQGFVFASDSSPSHLGIFLLYSSCLAALASDSGLIP